MTEWSRDLRSDPVPALLSRPSEALRYFARRDLLEGRVGPVEALWAYPLPQRILGAQHESGAWRYRGGNERIRSPEDYNQLETYRMLRELVEKYGFNKKHESIRRAARFLFSRQTEEGDFRGIAGNQYIPYYSAGFMELLIKAGFEDDPRIAKGFRWLLSIRQEDGGWTLPLRTVGAKLGAETFRAGTIHPDFHKPSSHLVTGGVLRAFAAHPHYRNSAEGRAAAELLASRFFKPDYYPDRRAASFWTYFSFPFWFTDLLSSMDSLSLMGLGRDHPSMDMGLRWFRERQGKDGLWRLSLRIMATERQRDAWISLAVCRVIKRLCS